MTDLTTDIATVIKETCAPDEPDLSDFDKPLLEAGLDSLDFASVLIALEEKFGVQLLFEDNLENVLSVNHIAKFISENSGK